MFRMLVIAVVILINFGCTGNSDGPVIIENFDSGSFGNWAKEGNAFGEGPSGEGETHYMLGFLGKGFVSSENENDEPATGTLTSPLFLIERNSIHFLIGAHEIHFMPGTKPKADNLEIQLLIDDQVVRSKIPDEFHAMFRRAWNVSEFKGREARIRIVDNDNRPGAHLDVDEIVQNDIPVKGALTKKKVVVEKPVLNFPVKSGAERHYIELFCEGKQIRAMDVELATDDIDYWVVTDLSEWQGKEIEIRTRQFARNNKSLLDPIQMADGILGAEDLYREPLRQQFHFSSKRGWLNDPNGLVYYDGEYHLFYQHNPFNWDHSRNDYNKTWGHAISTDLVHWEEQPGKIHPDYLGPIYSGSAVVDYLNTTGFKTGEENPIVCIYTSAGGRSPWSEGKKFNQSLAYSNDRGRTFTIYEKNPVQGNLDYINRDPKAIWHEPTRQWVIVLHFDERAMAFFTSKDLKTWELQSELESDELVDCPELFELAVDGDQNNKRWILYGGSGHYIIGEFNGKRFQPQTEEIQFHYGNCFYASQTFNNMPESDRRRVQMAWAVIPTPEMPFNMSMLFPVELTLHSTEKGLRMFAYPVKEIENIYNQEYKWQDLELKAGQNMLTDIQGELLDIEAEFIVSEDADFGFVINGFPVSYRVEEKLLSCGTESAFVHPENGCFRLRILVDRLSVEVYANQGSVYMPVRLWDIEENIGTVSSNKENGLTVFTKKNPVRIRSLKIRKLNSIWN